MKQILAFLYMAICVAASGNIAFAKDPKLLELEGITLQMNEAEVHTKMKAEGYEQIITRGTSIRGFSKFDQLLIWKKANPKHSFIQDYTGTLRYKNERGHISIRFTPFKDKTVVTSVRFFPSNVPFLGKSVPDCRQFADDARAKYEGQKRETPLGYFRVDEPMIFDGQIYSKGQRLSAHCSPRFTSFILLTNMNAHDVLKRQLDKALKE